MKSFTGEFTHKGIKYRVQMASGADQRKVSYILARSGLRELVQQLALIELGNNNARLAILSVIVRTLEAMEFRDFEFVADKMLERAYRDGDQNPVTIEDFRGEIEDYYYLMALALDLNFKGFFSSLTTLWKSADSSGQGQEEESTPASTGSSGDPAQE